MEIGLSQEFVKKRSGDINVEGTVVIGFPSNMVEIWGGGVSPHIFNPGTDRFLYHISALIDRQYTELLKVIEYCAERYEKVIQSFCSMERWNIFKKEMKIRIT